MRVTQIKRFCLKKSLYVFFAVFLFVFFSTDAVFAQGGPLQNGISQAGNFGGEDIGTARLQDIIINIVNIALGFLGIIAVIIIVYGGFLWMTSSGNEEQVRRAKRVLINATIGLAIILLAWVIAAFVINALLESSFRGTQGDGSERRNSGALGGGIIQSVYPIPGARDVPRNTHIFVTFKEAIDVDSIISPTGFIQGCGNSPVVEIVDQRENDIIDDNGECSTQVTTLDSRTFDFFPPLLGSATEPVDYTVRLTGGIDKADGTAAFSSVSATGVGFEWSFQVSTLIDATPPYVSSFRPRAGSDNPRNVIISITFNEAINPISLSPAGTDAIYVTDTTTGSTVSGTLFLAGDYRNVDFFPDSQCEGLPLNTCGEPIFCLPALATIETTIITDPTTAGIEGIQDASGNSFDGNRNGKGGEVLPLGPIDIGEFPLNTDTGDTAFWSFSTNDTIDIAPPLVLERRPDTSDSGVDLGTPLSVKMDKQLAISTVKPNGQYGDGKEYVTLVDPRRDVGYWTSGTNGNGCNSLCLNEGSDSVFDSVCGNSDIEPGEDCDDGNTRSFDGCSSNCLNEGTATCGDGLVTHREECDTSASPWDELENSGLCDPISCLLQGTDSCNSIVSINCCGNGDIDVGEACDDINDPGCNVPATGTPGSGFCLRTGSNLCGNGTIEPTQGETCDDGNIVNGDGCSDRCLNEGAACGFNAHAGDGLVGNLDKGEDCDGGLGCSGFCTNLGNATLSCGNSTADVSEGEDCDLGQLSNESYIFIHHTQFLPETDYGVRAGSGVRDAFQNCFLPCADSDADSGIGVIGGTRSCTRQSHAGSPIGWAESPGQWSSNEPFPSCAIP